MTVRKVGNVLAFPIERARMTAEINPEPGMIVPFPVNAAPPAPRSTVPATRRAVAELVCELADATGQHPKDINLDMMRRGFPRRADCTPNDLARIRDVLIAELSDRHPQVTA